MNIFFRLSCVAYLSVDYFYTFLTTTLLQVDEIRSFLDTADVASVIFDMEKLKLTQSLFICLRKFDIYPKIQCRTIHILEDVHLLSAKGISNEELAVNFDVLLDTLQAFVNNEEIVLNLLQLFAMVADRQVVKERSLPDHRSTTADKHVFLRLVEHALRVHSISTRMQRAGLQLFEHLIRNTEKKYVARISSYIVPTVLHILQSSDFDSSLYFLAFSIIETVATNAIETLLSHRDKILALCSTSVCALYSADIICKCFSIIDMLIEGDDQLSLLVQNDKGLLMMTDTLRILHWDHIDTIEIILNMMLCIMENEQVLKYVFSRSNKISLSKLICVELKKSFGVFLESTSRDSDAKPERIQTVSLWVEQIEAILMDVGEGLIDEYVSDDASIDESDVSVTGGGRAAAEDKLSSLSADDVIPSAAVKYIERNPQQQSSEQSGDVPVRGIALEDETTIKNSEVTEEGALAQASNNNTAYSQDDSKLLDAVLSVQRTQQQAMQAIKRADTMHKLFFDAVKKIEDLVAENDKLWGILRKFKHEGYIEGLESPDRSGPNSVLSAAKHHRENEQFNQRNADGDTLIAAKASAHGNGNGNGNNIAVPTPLLQHDANFSVDVSTISMSPNPRQQHHAAIAAQDDASPPQSPPPPPPPSTTAVASAAEHRMTPGERKKRGNIDNNNNNRVARAAAVKYPPIKARPSSTSSDVASSAKKSLCVAGVLEALQQAFFAMADAGSGAFIDPSAEGGGEGGDVNLSEIFNPENSEHLDLFADRLCLLFKSLKENEKDYVSTSSNAADEASISMRSMKRCIQRLNLIDGFIVRQADVEIVLKHLQVVRLSHYGVAFVVVAIGYRRFSDLSSVHLVVKLNSLIEVYINNVEEELLALNGPTPLQEPKELTAAESEDIKRILESERRALTTIFQSYISRFENEISPTGAAAAAASGGGGGGFGSKEKSSSGGGSAGVIRGMSFQNTVDFAKDFEFSPDIISRSQLAQIFETCCTKQQPQRVPPAAAAGGGAGDESFSSGVVSASPAAGSGGGGGGRGKRTRSPTLGILSYSQFLDFIVQTATRCPLFAESNPPTTKVSSFLLLLAHSNGKQRVLVKSRSHSVVMFKTTAASSGTSASLAGVPLSSSPPPDKGRQRQQPEQQQQQQQQGTGDSPAVAVAKAFQDQNVSSVSALPQQPNTPGSATKKVYSYDPVTHSILVQGTRKKSPAELKALLSQGK